MRNLILIFILAISMSAFAAPFTNEGQLYESAPSGHTPGKDNHVTDSSNRFHHPGEDCGICHQPGVKGATGTTASDFTMSGTIYTDRTGRVPLQGAEIILRDVNGKVISMTSNEAGNFATKEAIGSDPATYAPGTDATSPGTWRYKSWVKYGDYVSPMVTIAPVGGMSAARMGCSMHHGPTGSRGALNVGGASTLISYPAENISYKQHIQPILLNRCKACHVPSDASPNATYPPAIGTTPASTVKYNGGLDLATYTPSTKTVISDKMISNMVNTTTPDSSKLLTTVVMGSTGHAGGAFWKTTDPDYTAIRRWISEGAKNN